MTTGAQTRRAAGGENGDLPRAIGGPKAVRILAEELAQRGLSFAG